MPPTAPCYHIFVRTPSGHVILAFTWRGTPSEGLHRAFRDAQAFGVQVAAAWAVPITITTTAQAHQ